MPRAAFETPSPFRPPAPTSQAQPLGAIALLRTLRDNPLEAWTRAHFDQPIVTARLPFGAVVVVSDPGVFDPTRFLPPARETIDRYAYLPFGAGPRICIGATFALQEATLVLATIMRRFHLRLAPGSAVWPLQRVTLRPRGGLPMRIAARRPDRAAAEPARESRVHAG